jgi:hypothetical protein
MAAVACPFCYRPIDSSRLAFQCVGVGEPGRKGCQRRPDTTRQEATGFSGDALPTFVSEGLSLLTATRSACPDCGGDTGARACPRCHTPLSTTFVGSDSPLVGMVGNKGSGKTVYLTVLNHQLQGEVRRRFDADIRLAGDRQGGASSTEEYLAEYHRFLFEDGRLFSPTAQAADNRKEPLVLEWRQPRTRFGRTTYRTTTLSFYDTAGEDLKNQDDVHSQTYLGVANGLIVLLDPWQLPGVRDHLDVPDAAVTGAERPLDVLQRVTELLRASGGVRAGKAIKRPIAVAFAKMDALFPILAPSDPIFAPPSTAPGYDEEGGQAIDEYVRALLHRFGADAIDSHLRSNYQDFRYFAVSALGAQPDYKGTRIDPRGVQPFRVEDPLLWLLYRLGVLPRSKG